MMIITVKHESEEKSIMQVEREAIYKLSTGHSYKSSTQVACKHDIP